MKTATDLFTFILTLLGLDCPKPKDLSRPLNEHIDMLYFSPLLPLNLIALKG